MTEAVYAKQQLDNEMYVRYVFLDVVHYTGFATEDQAEIVESLQRVVKETVDSFDLPGVFENEVDFLPTGDGMCIVILRDEDDIHLQVALKILEILHGRNKKYSPKFAVRIGLNENKDIVYTDINNRYNYAGRGINIAQRVMALAGASQIVVGPAVYEKLGNRKKYQNKFKQYARKIKHGEEMMVYQYVEDSCRFLNSQELYES